MDKLRIGIIGIGNMGSSYLKRIIGNEINGAELAAVCDIKEERIKWAKEVCSEKVEYFADYKELLKLENVDAVLVVTPHCLHPEIAIAGLNAEKHILIDKPAGVYTKQVHEMNKVAENKNLVFGIMYNQRTNPMYQRLKVLIETGELGKIKRINWITTKWYRTQTYYNSGGWRATWEGEGGGVILNQAPHQLDLWQWIYKMPKRIRAFTYEAKHHNIEVEDEVTAYAEYEDGATAVFITSTGEYPGTNRLEVVAEKGKVVIEDEKFKYFRLTESEINYSNNSKEAFIGPEVWDCKIPFKDVETGHAGIMQNWTDCILKGDKLLAPGKEGINGLKISNAIYMSSWLDKWVDIDNLDEDLYMELLQNKIKNSTFDKKTKDSFLDVEGTH